jgi:protein TonB
MEERTSSSAFVNPADSYNRARVADNYLWQVVRKLVGYRYQAPGVEVDEAVTVVRVVIARDGRLIDVQIAQSSGIPQIDAGVIGGVRRGSPYAPLPDNIQGASATFFLPLVSVNRQ